MPDADSSYYSIEEDKLKFLLIVWFGTHEEYDKIDVKKVNYEN